MSADVAGKTILELQGLLGKDNITAKELLDASRDEKAPLHSCFEWDDSVAAENYRLYQARQIIGSIEIKVKVTGVENEQPTFVTVRAFPNTQPYAPKKKGEFVFVDTVLKNPDYRTQILKNAYQSLLAFKRNYENYAELSGVFRAIDDFGKTLD